MNKSSLGKVAAILLITLVLGFFDLPANLQTRLFPALPESVQKLQINLGLDLKGGSQLDYKIDLRGIEQTEREAVRESITRSMEKRVNALGVAEPNIYLSQIADEDHIIVELAGVDIETAKATVGKTVQLEFKEQKTTLDPEEKSQVDKQIADFLRRARENPDRFEELAQAEENLSAPGKTIYYKAGLNPVFKPEITDEYHTQITTLNPGQVWEEAIPLDPFLDIDSQGNLTQRQGTSVMRLIERRTAEFSDFAARYSEEENALQSRGLLPQPIASSRYGEKLATQIEAIGGKGSVSATPLESEYGYHLVKIDDIKEENGKKTIIASHLFVEYKDAKHQPAIERSKEEALKYAQELLVRIKAGESVYKVERLFFSTAASTWKDTPLNGKNFKRASVSINPNTQEVLINIAFDEEGAKLFSELTERNLDKPIAIFVGGNLISSPKVSTKITDGNAVITGYQNPKSAQQLANDLNTGALAAPISLTGQYNISASLGEEALATSLKAGLIGLLLLAIFMTFYYRLLGLIATLALALYTVLIIALIKIALPTAVAIAISVVVFIVLLRKIIDSDESGWEKLVSFFVATFVLFLLAMILSTPITLTLAGVAGVILSIGIAVDANILIFERMKEEFRAGRSLSGSIETGFSRAWSSIRDSNFSTLITCVILLWFGSSLIKGFAFNLSMGVVISMLSAITITKTLLKAFVGTRLAKNEFLFCAEKKESTAKFSFLKTRHIWYFISSVLIILSLIIMASGLKLGRDFTGGALLEVKLEKANSLEEIATAVTNAESEFNSRLNAVTEGENKEARADFGPANVIQSDAGTHIIRIKNIDENQHQAILQKLREKFGLTEELRFSTIGAAIGASMKEKAAFALSLAAVMIVLYVAFAFRHIPKNINPWRFGITTIVAVLHDLIIVTGVYLFCARFFAIEIDALFVTAMLTILGYSVNDTIVVFDRIRENIKKMGQSDFDGILEASLNQTLGRSINTSFSTLLPLIALFFLGGESVKWFVFTLIIGIVIGTYSSIFIASALLSTWKKFSDRHR